MNDITIRNKTVIKSYSNFENKFKNMVEKCPYSSPLSNLGYKYKKINEKSDQE